MEHKLKILYLDAATMGDASLEPIARLGELVCHPNASRKDAMEMVGDCDVLIVNKVLVTEQLLNAAPRLKLVCEAATGVNNIDLKACAERGIPVKNVAGYSTDSVVQSTFMHILNLMGNGRYFDNAVKSGKYSRSGMFTDSSVPFSEIAGKTLGIIGMGQIGSRVAGIGEAFGMKVIYFSTSGTNHCTAYPAVSLETLMKESDVISIHAPLNERTSSLIGEKELRMMKPTAFIVNAGRGGIIVEEDLAKVIDEGAIAGAGLDVYSVEPLPEDSPILHTRHPEKLSLSPHTAWASVEARARLVASIAKNIADSFPGSY